MGCGCRRRRRSHSCGRCGGHRGGYGGYGGYDNCYTKKYWKKECKCVPYYQTVCEAPYYDGDGDGDCHRHRHHHCHKKC